MSANVATNFPPQTYSSQFFLNVLTDDVASTSKKQSKNSDGSDSSSAVLDCFISTMHNMKQILILMLLCLQICLIAGQNKKYSCSEGAHTSISTFVDILELQKNAQFFTAQNNFVAFSTITISQIKKNDFIVHDSNHIRKLILNAKRIQLLDNGSFNELYCVKYLLLQDNLISTLNNGTFEGLYSLQELYLNGNMIREIPNGSFFNLKHLLKLDLSNNQIFNLYDTSLQYLKSLYELNLSHNKISTIPINFFIYCTHLNKLFLGNNKITNISSNNLNSLDLLDLQNNQLQSIDKSLKNLPVTEINLSGNMLIELNIIFLPGATQKINICHNYFQCSYLKTLIQELITYNIGITINDLTYKEFNKINIDNVGCYNGTPFTTSTTTTTTSTSTTTTPSTTTTSSTTEKYPAFDDERLRKIEAGNLILYQAVSDLKTVLIILIILIVMFHIIDIMIRTHSFSRLRERFFSPSEPVYVSRFGDSSFPLLQR